MSKRVKAASIDRSAVHVRRQSHTVRHLRLRVTLCILAALLAALGVYALAQRRRMSGPVGAVDVVVGSTLMARMDALEEDAMVPVPDALHDLGVRPTSRQVLILQGGDGLHVELTAEEAREYRFCAQDGKVGLYDETGAHVGVVERVYLPTDETSVKKME